MDEVWKKIVGFPSYSVSSHGRVRNDKSGRILRQHDRKGYKSVLLYDGLGASKRINVHRLVAMAFLSPTLEGEQINHKDGCKTNNNVSNLEWCTVAQNHRHSRDVLKNGLRRVLCVETGQNYESVKKAAEASGSYIPDIVRACKNGATAAGFHWKYVKEDENIDRQ